MFNRLTPLLYSQQKNRRGIYCPLSLVVGLLLLPWPTGAVREAANHSTALSLQQSTQTQGGAQITPQIDQDEKRRRASVEDFKRVFGPEHTFTTGQMINLAEVYRAKGDYVLAEQWFLRAVEIREKAQGPEHLDTAFALNRLGRFYRDKGDYAQAELSFRRALTIREKALGPEHLQTLNVLIALANLHNVTGAYSEAERQFRRALAICEKSPDRENPVITDILISLGKIYSDRGDYAQAELLLRRAAAIREKTLGSEHPNTALAWHRVGGVLRDQGHYAQAELLFRRVLAIREKAFGPKHVSTANVLSSLARLQRAKGDFAEAERLFRRALAIYDKFPDLKDSDPTMAAMGLGGLYRDLGDYAQAEPLLQRSLAFREKTFGPEHPLTISALTSLATLHRARGDHAQAIRLVARVAEVREKHVTADLAAGSEHQKRLYLDKLSGEADFIISLHTRSAPDDGLARRLALTTILQRKGRSLDAMSDQLSALRSRASPKDRQLLDAYLSVCTRLATLQFGSADDEPMHAIHRATVASLAAEKARLEDEISRSSVEFRAQSQPVAIEALQAAIPSRAALVEFAVYHPVDAQNRLRESSQYVAYVLPPQGEPLWVELGEAAAIEQAVDELRQALRNPRSVAFNRRARRLDEMVMQPVRRILGDTGHILILPDGVLNLIPFAALVDEQNEFLIKRYAITYLTSGRDLLRLQIARESKSASLVVADPVFGKPATNKQVIAQASATAKLRERAINNNSDLGVYLRPFEKVAGAEDEAKRLKRIFPEATVLTQHEATETSLKKTSAPRILHISTHGFFLDDLAMTPENERRARSLRSGSGMASEAVSAGSAALLENPLLVSGLALAGANQRKRGDDDGILTALEVAGLDLWGTKLVTLSACDTGVGRVKNGEGVYGLRRALVLAGSESQVMSLWKVDGLATRDLMTDYYKKLIQKGGRGEALRQAQLEMLKNPKRRHPFYWASFIQSGEWANLDGKR